MQARFKAASYKKSLRMTDEVWPGVSLDLTDKNEIPYQRLAHTGIWFNRLTNKQSRTSNKKNWNVGRLDEEDNGRNLN